MTEDNFGRILSKYVLPMYTGATLKQQASSVKRIKRFASLRNRNNLIVRLKRDSASHFCIHRSQDFEPEDASFIASFVDTLHDMESMWEKSYFNDLLPTMIRRLVAKKVAPLCEQLVTDILGHFEIWSEQTYEGKKISAAVGIDPKIEHVADGVSLLDLYKESFGSVLANGLDSFLIASKDGLVAAHKPMQITDNPSLLAPLRFAQLAEWSRNDKLGLGLNRHGEILVFKDSKLAFAKRRGVWHHFTHNAVMQRMSLRHSFPKSLCRAVYQSCLDVSFARTGGCIAIARLSEMEALLSEGTIDRDDLLEYCSGTKTRCLRAIVKLPFHQIDRRLRQDLLAMDGATILDYQGNVLTCGAIVKVDAGSEGGGRLAAAKALAKFGLSVKVSSDGAISGFSERDKLFSVG